MGAQRRDRRALARRDLPDGADAGRSRRGAPLAGRRRTTRCVRPPAPPPIGSCWRCARAWPKRSSIPTAAEADWKAYASASTDVGRRTARARRLLSPSSAGAAGRGRAGRGGARSGSAGRSAAACARAAIVANLRAALRARRRAAAARRVRRSAVPRLDRALSAGSRALRPSVSLPRRPRPHGRRRGAAGRLSTGVSRPTTRGC